MKAILIKLSKLMSVRVLAIGLTFLQTVVMTRVFGSELFGILSIALSISALLVLLLAAGLDQLLMRDIARNGIERVVTSHRWKNLWWLILRCILPLTFSVALSGVLLFYFTPLANIYALPLIAVFSLLPFIIIRKYSEAIALGTKQVIRSIMGSQIIYPILMILGGFYVWYSVTEPGTVSVALTYSFAAVGSAVASLLLISGTLSEILSKKAENETTSNEDSELSESSDKKVLLNSGFHFSLVSFGFVLGQHIDVLMMGVFSTPDNVAIVRIAARVAEMAGLIRAIIVLQYRPLLAEAHAKKDTVLLQKHATFMAKIFTLTGVPLALFLWLFAEQVMMVFGPEFVNGAWPMRIYVAGVLVTLLFGPMSSVLAMSGNEGIASRILIASIFLQVALNLVLIPLVGATGCAIANFTSMCFLAIVSRVMINRKVGIETSILGYFVKSNK